MANTCDEDLPALDITKSSASFHRFMDLPLELREVIWEYAMRGTPYLVARGQYLWASDKYAQYLVSPVEIREFLKRQSNVARPSFLPSICRLSKSTMGETIRVYIRGSTFMVASIHDNRFLDAFVQTVDKGYEAIRSIHFAFFDCFPGTFPQNADLELAVRCSGLHTVKLSFHVQKLTIWVLEGDYDDGLTRYPRPVNEIWTHYKFSRLLDCANLQKLIIERKGGHNYAGHEASEKLGDHIKAEYKVKHGREIELAYT